MTAAAATSDGNGKRAAIKEPPLEANETKMDIDVEDDSLQELQPPDQLTKEISYSDGSEDGKYQPFERSAPAGLLDLLLFVIPNASLFLKKEHQMVYSLKYFLKDFQAAVTIAFVLIPQSIGYAALAGVSPIVALLSAVYPVIIYAILGSSRHLSVGPEALTSTLVGIIVFNEMQLSNHTMDPNAIAATVGFLIGSFSLLMSLLRLHFFDSIVTGYSLTGFVLGIAMLIIFEQIPGLFGLPTSLEGDISPFNVLINNITAVFDGAQLAPSLFGISCLLYMITWKIVKHRFRKTLPNISGVPEILILVVVSVILSQLANLSSFGIPVIGAFNNQLIAPKLPYLSFQQIGRLIPNIAVISILGLIESQTATRIFGARESYFPKPNRELFALGIGNFVGSLFGTFPTFGSLPRSRILYDVGGQTGLVGGMAALIVFLLVLTCGGVLALIPKGAIAAIVTMAAVNLVEFQEIMYLIRRREPQDILMFVASWGLTIFLPISISIWINMGMSALFIIRRATNVDLAVLGKVTMVYKDHQTDHEVSKEAFVHLVDYPEAEVTEDIMVIAIMHAVEFFNAGNLPKQIEKMSNILPHEYIASKGIKRFISQVGPRVVKSSRKRPRIFVLDFTYCEQVDSCACFTLREVVKNTRKLGSNIIFSGMNPSVHAVMEASGLLSRLGSDCVSPSTHEAVMRAKTMLHAPDQIEIIQHNPPPSNLIVNNPFAEHRNWKKRLLHAHDKS